MKVTQNQNETKKPSKKPSIQDRYIRDEPTREELEILNYKLYQKLGCLSSYEKKLDEVMFNNKLGNESMILKEKKKKTFKTLGVTSEFDDKREFCKSSERILDIPGIIDDYYLNILDWSKSNFIGIGLTDQLYLYQYSNGKSFKLTNLKENEYISSLKFEKDHGNFVSIGTSKGEIELWDIEREKRIRILKTNERNLNERILSLDWNHYMLTSGGNDKILNHDVRCKEHVASTLNFHKDEVCGLLWSNDGKYLCSGGNDNTSFIFDINQFRKPLLEIKSHHSSIKSINWICDHVGGGGGGGGGDYKLLTGGGLNDGQIKLWSIRKLEEINSYSLNSQISGISSSKYGDEFISTSGFGHYRNEITIFSLKNKIKKIFNLKGHTNRILNTIQSPLDNEKICTASSDETIRIWNIFKSFKNENEKNSPLSIKDLHLR